MEKHLWKDRVVLIYSADEKSVRLKNQLAALKKNKDGLLERKLVVYRFTKEKFAINFENNWQKSDAMFSKFKPKNESFQVLLIGLDGGMKHSQNVLLSSEKLFSIIDGMPMRKREIKKNNQ